MNDNLSELVDLVRKRVANAPLAKPRLRLLRREDLTEAPPGLDAVSRDCMILRIRDLARMYWLAWLVRQEVEFYGRDSLEGLEDDELRAVRQKMESARECRVDGVAFDEACLVRDSTAGVV